jgi:hypothetical membrane protein
MSTMPDRRTAAGTLAAGRPTAAIDPSGERGLESLALAVGTIAFVVTALVALAAFRLQAAPIAGENSVGQFAALASAVAAILAFVAGRYVTRTPGIRLGALDVVDIAALALAHGVIALLTWTLLADVFERGFVGAEVFAVPLLALSGTAAAISAYVVFYSATHMSLSLLAVVLAVFLVQGVLASTLTSSDPHWWEMNLSALGMTDDLSAFAFNLTLIVAGVIVTTLARYATKDLPTTHSRGARNVRACLIVVGVFLACVGIFHVDDFFWVHNSVATGMAVAFAGVRPARLAVPGGDRRAGRLLRRRLLHADGRRAGRGAADLLVDHPVPAERGRAAAGLRGSDLVGRHVGRDAGGAGDGALPAGGGDGRRDGPHDRGGHRDPLQRVVPELQPEDDALRRDRDGERAHPLVEDAGDGGRCAGDPVHDRVRVRPLRHGDAHLDIASPRAVAGMVDERAGEQLRVGHVHGAPIDRVQDDGA